MLLRKTLNPFDTALDRIDQDLFNIGHLDFVIIDLKYNGTDNFMNEDLYLGFNKAFLQAEAYKKFVLAGEFLKMTKKNYKFLILDALRPRSIQKKMFNFVKNTPMESYVANPDKGSMHNFGMALDLTLVDELGIELDMGTGFDDFSEKAQPRLEHELFKAGKLSSKQIENRNFLKTIMTNSGFEQLPHEWWHYNAFEGDFVRTNFKIIE